MLEALVHEYLPEAYLAPPEVAEDRELMRCYQALRKTATQARNLLRALLARQGVELTACDLCGAGAQEALDQEEARLTPRAQMICGLYRRLLAEAEASLALLKEHVRARAAALPLARALQAQPGQGAHVNTALGVLGQHDADRAVFAGKTAPAQRHKQTVFFFPMVALVGKALKEPGELRDDVAGGCAAIRQSIDIRFQGAHDLFDQPVFIHQDFNCWVHRWPFFAYVPTDL